MFLVPVKGAHGNKCVANCESVGMYFDSISVSCVGCHPACENCFGPENEQCFGCAKGFVQIDNHTCDTECSPENSYVIKDICFPCNKNCKECYGPEIDDCIACYPPYSIERENNECLYNETLHLIMIKMYTPVSFPSNIIASFVV